MRRTNVIRAAALGAASLLGGLVALGGVTLTGDLGGGTTTVVRTSPAPTPAAPVADDGRLTVSEIYARAAPGVVQITSTAAASDNPSAAPFEQQAAPRQALGSGFVIDKTGHIVTNYHVIEGADADRGQLLEPGHPQRHDRRQRPLDRHRRPARAVDVARPRPARVRELRHHPRRRSGGCDRQPVRPPPDRDRRHRQRGPGADDHGAERLSDRPRDPDRRGDQQRQLRRAAAERARRSDRRQLADRPRRRVDGQRRDRLRRALEHRQGGRRAADRHRQGRPCLSRDLGQHGHGRAGARLPAPRRRGRARRGPDRGERGGESRAQGRDDGRRRRRRKSRPRRRRHRGRRRQAGRFDRGACAMRSRGTSPARPSTSRSIAARRSSPSRSRSAARLRRRPASVGSGGLFEQAGVVGAQLGVGGVPAARDQRPLRVLGPLRALAEALLEAVGAR